MRLNPACLLTLALLHPSALFGQGHVDPLERPGAGDVACRVRDTTVRDTTYRVLTWIEHTATQPSRRITVAYGAAGEPHSLFVLARDSEPGFQGLIVTNAQFARNSGLQRVVVTPRDNPALDRDSVVTSPLPAARISVARRLAEELKTRVCAGP